jgi:hypothetical protein
MAQGIIPYVDGYGTKYGVAQEIALNGVLYDLAKAAPGYSAPTAPFGSTYGTLAELQAVSGWSGAIALPGGLTPRKLQVAVGDIGDGNPQGLSVGTVTGTTSVIVGDPALAAILEPTGATPFPEAALALTTAKAQIVGLTGESRSSN